MNHTVVFPLEVCLQILFTVLCTVSTWEHKTPDFFFSLDSVWCVIFLLSKWPGFIEGIFRHVQLTMFSSCLDFREALSQCWGTLSVNLWHTCWVVTVPISILSFLFSVFLSFSSKIFKHNGIFFLLLAAEPTCDYYTCYTLNTRQSPNTKWFTFQFSHLFLF